MSRVQYDGKRLIPAPFVTITKNYNRSDDGQIIGKTYSISLRGTITAFKGSPTSSGTFWTISGYPSDEVIVADSRLGAILRKQQAIRNLFSQDYKSMEIQSLDATQPLKFFPRIISIETPEGSWYDKCEYTINMEADRMYPENNTSLDSASNLESVSETWSIETNEQAESEFIPRTYALRHALSAKGKRLYDETGVLIADAWEIAKNYCVPLLGFNSQIALSSGVNNLPSYYQGYNLIRSENIDKKGGSYSTEEMWVLSSGSAFEEFNISMESNLDNPYQTVTIDGNITGLEVRDSNMNLVTAKWSNALSKFVVASGQALYRAQNYSGLTLNSTPLSFTQGRNPVTGTINYSIQYNTRPTNLIPNAKSEVIAINDSRRGDVFAAIFCIGRSAGPVLQNLGAKTEATRTLNIEVVVTPPTYSDSTVATLKNLFNNNPRLDSSYSGAIQNIIDAANPINNGYTQSFSSPPQETWDIHNGRYSYNVSWTYE